MKVFVEVLENDFKISVIDEGPGISEDVLPQVFEKFYRLPGSSSTGMGLGLAIVKSVMDIHQGKIEVEKANHKGTIITLILPMT